MAFKGVKYINKKNRFDDEWICLLFPRSYEIGWCFTLHSHDSKPTKKKPMKFQKQLIL